MCHRLPRQLLPLLLVALISSPHSAARGDGSALPDTVAPTTIARARAARIEALRKEIKRPGTPDSVRLALARAYHRNGTIEDRGLALGLYDTIRRTYQRDTGYHRELAKLYEECQQPSRARGCLEELIQLDPHDVEARVEIARLRLRELTYHFDLALTEPMLEVLKPAREDAPTHRDAFFLSSLALELTAERPGKWSPAQSRQGQAWLQSVLDRDPRDNPARLLMAVHALDLGRTEEAARAFSAAVDSGPADQRAAFHSARWTIPSGAPTPAPGTNSAELAKYHRLEWRRVDPTPLTDRNENQLIVWKRLTLADQLFGNPERGVRGWDTPPGEAFVRYGEPMAHDFNPGEVSGGPGAETTLPRLGSGWSAAREGATLKLVPPSWSWGYRFRDVKFTLRFEDVSLNGSYRADDETAQTLTALRRLAPIVFQEAAPGSIQQIYVASAGVRADAGKVRQGIYVGVPFWRKNLERERLGKIKLEVVVRDSTRALVRQALHYAAAADAYALEPGLDLLLWSPSYELAPGAYSVTALVSDPERDIHGVASTLIEVRDYRALPELTISDLELALNSDSTTAGPTVTKLGRTYVPNPLALAGADGTVDVFYEIYGLTARAGVAQQQVRYTVLPRAYMLAFDRFVQEGRALPADLLATAEASRARGEAGLTAENSIEVVFPPAAVRVTDGRAPRATRISLAGLAPGEYAFIVTVLDLTNQATASAVTMLRVMDDAQRAALRAYAARE